MVFFFFAFQYICICRGWSHNIHIRTDIDCPISVLTSQYICICRGRSRNIHIHTGIRHPTSGLECRSHLCIHRILGKIEI